VPETKDHEISSEVNTKVPFPSKTAPINRKWSGKIITMPSRAAANPFTTNVSDSCTSISTIESTDSKNYCIGERRAVSQHSQNVPTTLRDCVADETVSSRSAAVHCSPNRSTIKPSITIFSQANG